MPDIENWGKIDADKIDRLKKTLEDALSDDGELSGLWLKVDGWYIKQANSSERRMKRWERISDCLAYKDTAVVKGLLAYVTWGKQGYIRIDKKYNVTYEPGFWWHHQAHADTIKKYLKEQGLLKTKRPQGAKL